eukprot:gene2395-1498_t
MGWKRRCIRNGKGKEKQLFRGIFAFIANRDLFAQSDFYFFHDSLRSAMPAPEKLYRLRRSFGGGFMPARARPRSLRRSPVDKNICVEAIEPTSHGVEKEMKKRKGKRNSCFAAFSPSLRIDLFAQSDFYFSTIHACRRRQKIVQVEKKFWPLSPRGFPHIAAAHLAPALGRERQQQTKESLKPWGGKKEMHKKRKGKRNSCFAAFSFIANRDLLRRSFGWFHAGARPPQKPATQPRRCRRANRHHHFFLTALRKTRVLQRRKRKQLFRGIFAFIANRDLFAQSDFFIFPRFVEKNFDDGFHAGARSPQKPATQPQKQLFRGIFAFIANRDLF